MPATVTPPKQRQDHIVLLLALADVVLHLATADRYGIFRDELYYIACARHLSFGYVDHPPLIAFVAWLVIHTLGTALFALRLLPALAGGALVLLTAALARELGGSRCAQRFAAFAIVPVPIYLILHHWLTMNAFEPLLWMALAWSVLCAIKRNHGRYFLLAGAICGAGLENKYSILVCVFGILIGLLLTPERRWLANRYLWVGALLALLLFLPNLLWLIHNHFPFLEFERNSRMSGSRIERRPLAFLADQAFIMNPLLAPLWIAGVAWLLVSGDAKKYRALGIASLTILLTLLLLKAKNYYVAPAYPLAFAAGAVALDRWQHRWITSAYALGILLSGIALAPLVMPILPIQTYLRLQQAVGGFTPVRIENLPQDTLPQYFADEFGWQEMAQRTAAVYASLPLADRADTAIFANNYGEAAAIDFFGPRYGLPASISNSETYWLWGPRPYTGKSVIVLGSDGKGDREHFKTVIPAGVINNPYARADEHFKIFLCRDLVMDLHELWPSIKRW